MLEPPVSLLNLTPPSGSASMGRAERSSLAARATSRVERRVMEPGQGVHTTSVPTQRLPSVSILHTASTCCGTREPGALGGDRKGGVP